MAAGAPLLWVARDPVRGAQPAWVLPDMTMPGLEGDEATRRLGALVHRRLHAGRQPESAWAMLGAMDRRDPATAEAALAPDAVKHTPALLRKLADGTYRVELHAEPGLPPTATVYSSLVAALNSEARYVHAWRPVTEAERRAGAFGPDVLYVVRS